MFYSDILAIYLQQINPISRVVFAVIDLQTHRNYSICTMIIKFKHVHSSLTMYVY